MMVIDEKSTAIMGHERALSQEGLEVVQDGHDLPEVIHHQHYNNNGPGSPPILPPAPYSQPGSPWPPQQDHNQAYQQAPTVSGAGQHPPGGYYNQENAQKDAVPPATGQSAFNEKNQNRASDPPPFNQGMIKKRRRRKWLIIGGIILLIIVIAAVVGGILGTRKKDNGGKASGEASTTNGTGTGSAASQPSSSAGAGVTTQSDGDGNALPKLAGASSACHGGVCKPLLQTVSWKEKRFIFGLSAAQSLMVKSGDNNKWDGDWQDLGGVFKYPPIVVSWADGRIDAIGVQSDTIMYQKTYSSGSWASSWVSMGGLFTSGPAAACWGEGRIDAFGRGTDGALWHNWYTSDTAKWGGWESRGGIIQGPPTVAAWGPNRLDVFARGTDQALFQQYWDGTTWSSWTSLSGVIVAEPIVVSSAPNTLDIFVLGQGNSACWRGYHNGWLNWQCLGNASYESLPAPVVLGSDRVDFVIVGSDDHVYHRSMSGSTWSSDWDDLGGPANSAAVALAGSDGKAEVFSVGMDTQMYSSSYTSSAFSWSSSAGWEGIGGNFSSLV